MKPAGQSEACPLGRPSPLTGYPDVDQYGNGPDCYTYYYTIRLLNSAEGEGGYPDVDQYSNSPDCYTYD